MSLKPEEKSEASQITQQFFVERVGVIGNMTGSVKVSIDQSYRASTIGNEDLQNLLYQVKTVVDQLPEHLQEDVKASVTRIEAESSKVEPDQSKLRSRLKSLKAVCEGATGNLVAQGIARLIEIILA